MQASNYMQKGQRWRLQASNPRESLDQIPKQSFDRFVLRPRTKARSKTLLRWRPFGNLRYTWPIQESKHRFHTKKVKWQRRSAIRFTV